MFATSQDADYYLEIGGTTDARFSHGFSGLFRQRSAGAVLASGYCFDQLTRRNMCDFTIQYYAFAMPFTCSTVTRARLLTSTNKHAWLPQAGHHKASLHLVAEAVAFEVVLTSIAKRTKKTCWELPGMSMKDLSQPSS